MQRRRNNFSVINPLRLILIIGTYSSIVLASGIDLGELSDLYEVIPTSKFTVEDLVASLEVKKETKRNEDLNLLSGEIKYGEVKKNKKRKDDREKETKDDKIQILNVTSSSGDNKNDTQNQQQTNISSSSGENKNNKVNKTTNRQRNKQTEWQIDKNRVHYKHKRRKDKQTYYQTEQKGQPDKQTQIQITLIQTNKQTNKQTKTHTNNRQSNKDRAKQTENPTNNLW